MKCQPKQILVETDRLRLQQVILNLARNSAKFVESGYVRLRCSVNGEGHVCIYIEDSGPGVPEDKRKNLFCRFQESLDSLAQGTGVGLNLCKSLVDLMEGDIWLDESFESGVEGKLGARVVVNLKRPQLVSDDEVERFNDAAEAALIAVTEERLHIPENLTALFVDDDRILRKLGLRTLTKVTPTWTVREAANGETALQLIDKEHFDIIFMDQYMTSVEQALKGTETVRALRSRGIESVICGLSANNLEETFLAAGADGFILKPFPCKESELRRELTRLLALNPKATKRLSASQRESTSGNIQTASSTSTNTAESTRNSQELSMSESTSISPSNDMV